MSNYTKATNFASKDALLTGNPSKIVKGTEIDNEFNAISTAVSTKFDTTALAAPGPIGATTPAAISGTTINGTTGTFTGNVQMASANSGQLAGLRNKIINGNMGIFQRGTTAVTTSGNYGPADRWVVITVGDTFSTTQGSFVSGDTLYDTGGAQYFTTVAVTSVAGAGNFAQLEQRIEDVRLLAGQTVTVSFWAKAAAGTPLIGLAINQNFGTGGSPSTSLPGVGQSQALTTTWTKYSKTLTVPSINGKTIGTTANTSYSRLTFWLDAGSTYNTDSGTIGQSSKTVSIAQVQVEVGPVATPFEQRPIGMELALCQRYLPVVSTSGIGILATGGTITSNTGYADIPLFVTPRVAPTGISLNTSVGNYGLQVPGVSAGGATAITFTNSSLTYCKVAVTVGGTPFAASQPAEMYTAASTIAILMTGCEL